MSERFVIDKPIRLIELFGGIGTQAMAFRNIGADFERYRLVEFDKYCIASYNAIHGTEFEPMDITQIHGEDLGIVDTDKYCYVLTFSFPCTDLSVAGKMQGMSKGSGTRSGLLWEVERLLNEVDNLPQVLFMENVPQVHGKKNIDDFNLWLDFLTSKGYKTYYQDLNAKDFGVAQSRNRCFAWKEDVRLSGFHFTELNPMSRGMNCMINTVFRHAWLDGVIRSISYQRKKTQ